MDVGGTKRDVVDAARRTLRIRCPRSCRRTRSPAKVAGVANADAMLYSGRQVILTPLSQDRPELVQKGHRRLVGDRLAGPAHDAGDHDAAFAAVSHLPRTCSRSPTSSSVANQPAGRDFLSLAGPGFRDFTRIAAGDPAVWRDILLSNREEILRQSLRFRHTSMRSST